VLIAGGARKASIGSTIMSEIITLSTGHCVALAEEWEANRNLPADHNLTEEEAEEEIDRMGDRQNEIEQELAETPAATLADAVAKARVLAHCEHQNIYTAEVGLAASLFADLERMAGAS
jgi:hypothetical protein